MEHFGITTVEAMAAGCVPVVINKAGQREIVEDGVSGFLWNTWGELKDRTQLLAEDGNLRTGWPQVPGAAPPISRSEGSVNAFSRQSDDAGEDQCDHCDEKSRRTPAQSGGQRAHGGSRCGNRGS